MAYIDYQYYSNTFHGTSIPQSQFDRIAEIASDTIDAIVTSRIVVSDLSEEALAILKKAAAYQIEHLYLQGGIDAANGMALSDIGSESLGDYSVSSGSRQSTTGRESTSLTMNGVPFSALAYSLLKRAGFISRWAYAGTVIDDGF